MQQYIFELANEAETLALARAMAEALPRQAVLVFLEGTLGAGKTTFSRGLIQALGHQGNVKSPTYSLMEPYAELAWPVHHLDLYRLGDPEELEYLGLRDVIGNNGLVLIEWPEKGASWLPTPQLKIKIQLQGDGRRFSVEADDVLSPIIKKINERFC